MKTTFSRFLFAVLVALMSSAALADTIPITGTPPLSTIAGGPFDSIDLANLNTHFSIPVFSRPGVGIPFSYNLSYDSLMWVVSSSGAWQPVPNWGWRGASEASLGYVGYQTTRQTCPPGEGGGFTYTYNNFTYHDAAGGVHPFDGSIVDSDCIGSSDFGPPEHALDNSGYTLASLDGQFEMTVTSKSGIKYTPPIGLTQGSGTVSDPNGNTITTTISGSGSGMVTTLKDTLGTTALTIYGSPPTSNCESFPVKYQYSAPSATAIVTVRYKTYAVQTNFQIGISEFPSRNVCLVDKVNLSDTSYYQFTYEVATGLSGKYTGRIASVTLPTGGTISYSYAGTGCGNNSNCIMADGSPSHMARILGGGQWTYTRAIQSGQHLPQTTLTVVDPASNETDLKFSSIYETERKVYQGAASLNQILDYSYTCYNRNYYDSTCPTAIVTAPPTGSGWSRGHNDHANQITFGAPYSSVWDYYDTYGNLTNETDYTFASPPTPIRLVNNTYYGCTSNNICNELANSQVTDGGGASKSYTTYSYDEGGGTHGLVTSINRSTTGSTGGPFLSQLYSYNSNGTLKTATDPNGTVTDYHLGGYSCGSGTGAFPNAVQTVVNGVTLKTSYSYNCTGGVVLSVKDPNQQTVTTSYTDPDYWRPASSTDQLGKVTSYYYYGVSNPASHVTVPGQVESVMNWGSSTADSLSTPDAYDRPFLQQRRQSPTSSNWDTTQVVFDASGRVQQTSLPFSAAPGPHPVYGNKSITGYDYDTLGRYRDTFTCDGYHCNGPYTSFSYNANDAKITAGSGAGDQTFSKQLEYDALGRVTSVCELSPHNLPGVADCQQNNNPGNNGYKTLYTYDPLGDLLSVNQSGQTRTYVYDGFGRMTLESNPESAAKSYTFDSVGAGYCAPSVGMYTSTGDLVATDDANGAHVCYYYDGLHRLMAVGNNAQSATNPCHRFRYDDPNNGYKGPPPAGISPMNAKGRLVEAATDNCGDLQHDPLLTDEWFNYSPRGETLDTWQSTPHSGGWYHVQESYFPNGAMASLHGFTGTGTSSPFSNLLTFTLDGEGRRNSVGGVAPSITYNEAGQPLSVTQYAGGSETFQYEPYEERMSQWQSTAQSTAGSKHQTGMLTWSLNGTLQQLQIADDFNPANRQTCTNGYDDLARIMSVRCGVGGWGQDFSYDALGNITKTVPQGYTGVSFTPHYNSNNHVASFTYDLAGQVTNDLDTSFAYDVYGHPTTTDATTNTFDAFGRAVDQVTPGYLYNEIVYSPDGAKFAFMDQSALVKYIVPIVAGMAVVHRGQPFNDRYFQHIDWLGSSRLGVTDAGAVEYDRAYAPFGEVYAELSHNDTNRNFTGQRQDLLSGVDSAPYDFAFREQGPDQGRWETPDPAGLAAADITDPQTWNRYAYVGNNPLSNVDPQGLCDEDSGQGNTMQLVKGAAEISVGVALMCSPAALTPLGALAIVTSISAGLYNIEGYNGVQGATEMAKTMECAGNIGCATASGVGIENEQLHDAATLAGDALTLGMSSEAPTALDYISTGLDLEDSVGNMIDEINAIYDGNTSQVIIQMGQSTQLPNSTDQPVSLFDIPLIFNGDDSSGGGGSSGKCGESGADTSTCPPDTN